MHQLHKTSFIHQLHKVFFIHCFCLIRQNFNIFSTFKTIALKNVIEDHTTFEKINLSHSYYFFDNTENIDPNLLSINKKCIRNTDDVIYEIKYITIQSINNQNIDKGIPLCLSFSDVDACIIEENENKYLIFALTESDKEVLELYKKLWSEIEKQINK